MITYKDAGVDVEAGYESVKLMKDHVKKTIRPEVLSGLGGFGGLFGFDKNKYTDPVLVSGTDGVGTKLKIAYGVGKNDTIGVDCVAMCVNDIVCSGAEPLFFLDYIATWKNIPEMIADIVKGVADGCVQSGCALIGGETAEMPGIYNDNEFDLAGFAVGVVDKNEIIDGSQIIAGDTLIGLASTGVHSNGFSLVRKLVGDDAESLKKEYPELDGTIGETLLTPTKIYVKSILALKEKFNIKGISHITGGGFIENIPRMLPDGLMAEIKKGTWPILPIFDILISLANMDDAAAYNTFNMGIGMVVAIDEKDAEAAVAYLNELGEKAYVIGKVKAGEGVELC